MKKLILTMLLLISVLCAAGCGRKIPEPVDEEKIMADLPEEFRTVTINGETWAVQETVLEIQERDTNLDHQTDDVECRVELSGEAFVLNYTCELHYAYVRSSGWELRSYELTGEPALTLEESACMGEITQENQAKLQGELGYDTVELMSEDWDQIRDSYQQTYSVARETDYLRESGTVQMSGALTRESGFCYVWQSSTGEVVTQTEVKLEGTVWHFSSQEQRVEAAFQVTEQSDGMLTLSGLVRGENWAGNIKEKTLETQVEWRVSEFGCITFALPDISSKAVECNIQSDKQWVNLDGLYLGNLEAAVMPDSGEMSELMELDIENWLNKLPLTEETETPEQPENPGGSLWDYITNLFGF